MTISMDRTRTISDVHSILDKKKPKHVMVGFFDIDSVFRGKFISIEKFNSALKGGYSFCDAVLGWDCADELYDNAKFTGWHSGFPDTTLNVIPESVFELPFNHPTLFFLSEFSGKAESICPRGLLKRVLAKADSMGYEVKAAIEFEFFMFRETSESINEKGFRYLDTLSQGSFSYSALRAIEHEDLYEDILQTFNSIGIELEGLHAETGPGVLETAIAVDDALCMADKAAIFKPMMKILAQRKGLMATFMAKWNQHLSGQSGHTHLSLWSKDGESCFYDQQGTHNMSETMRYFLGGQLAFLPAVTAMIAPTVNSFSRLTPGYWAPTSATWGVDNRTVAIRIIPGSKNSQRIEYRVPGSDVNPYLSLAASIGTGLLGIENKIDPGDPATGNAYNLDFPDEKKLPTNLENAAIALSNSPAIRELFGTEFIEHYTSSRIWEARQFGKAVTEWELERYFEAL